MSINVYDVQFDEVIKSFYLTVSVSYDYAVRNFVPLVDKLKYQRNPLRASFYERLEEDILKGCIMPNITLAINYPGDLPEKEVITGAFIENNLSDAFILDGIQRLTTMQRISGKGDFPHERKLYCNILICNSMDRLLYRMITLNNGQRPMTARHQIETLAENLFDFDSLPILSVTEKESKGKRKGKSEDVMSKEVLIKGYLAYISDSVNIDNQKIIESKMNELVAEKIMESNIPEKEGEFKSVIEYINGCLIDDGLNTWFKVPNNFIGFTASMNRSFDLISNVNQDELAACIKTFEEAFSALDVSKIKLGMARRKLVYKFFLNFENLKSYSVNKLIDYISQEL